MRPNISEFSFGYALTECLIEFFRSQALSLTAAPLFPSLYDEVMHQLYIKTMKQEGRNLNESLQ